MSLNALFAVMAVVCAFQLQRRCLKLNKNELIKRVAEKLDGASRKTAAQAVEAVFESIAEGLQEDGVVTIGKWGTYSAEDM